MTTPRHAVLYFIMATLTAGGASAQPTVWNGTANATVVRAKGDGAHFYRSSKIIGSNVRNLQNKKIGEIKDLLLDSRRGEIAYAVVSFGGVMSVGRTYHAIPWQALQPGDDGKGYVLSVDRETINLAPGFDRGAWPDLTDQKWSAEIDRYWSRRVGRASSINTLPPSGADSGVAGGAGGLGTSGK